MHKYMSLAAACRACMASFRRWCDVHSINIAIIIIRNVAAAATGESRVSRGEGAEEWAEGAPGGRQEGGRGGGLMGRREDWAGRTRHD